MHRAPPLILDTGATGHFLTPLAATRDKKPTNTPVTVQLPDHSTIQSTHTASLPLHSNDVPPTATTAHIFPHLRTSLISVGKLCDSGCTAHFNKDEAVINYKGKVVVRGNRTPNGLWTVFPSFTRTAQATTVTRVRHRIKDHLSFLHAACFSPVKSTWIKAIKNNNFVTWPAVNQSNVNKHLPKSVATAKGHLDQLRQGTNSTKPQEINPDTNEKTHEIFTLVVDLKDTGQTYSDLTGQYPVLSSSGNRYLLILYDYDSNAILVEPLKNRTGPEILRGHQALFERLRHAGCRPKLHRLDNEASKVLKDYLRDQDIDFQLAPPHIHRRNAAERAIRTFKNHLIAGLSSCDPNFPIHLWDKLLPQAELTLNLLRNSRVHPHLSSYQHICGNFDFNRTPLAPPGTKVVLHEKPSKRASWAPHGLDGWYVGPALDHYRCYQVYVPSTRSLRIVDTIEFFPHHVPLPHTSSTDILHRAATDLIDALKNPHPATPDNFLSTSDRHALDELANIFKNGVAPRVEEKSERPNNVKRLHTPQPLPPSKPPKIPTRKPIQPSSFIDDIDS